MIANRIHTVGVPIWVTIFTAVMGVLGLFVGLAALVDPALFFFTEADDALGQRWAGRMIGVGIVNVGAVIVRSRPAYVLALLAGIAREVGDLAGAVTDERSPIAALVTLLVGVAALAHISRTPVATPAE